VEKHKLARRHREEVMRKKQGSSETQDRLGKLCEHLINQRNFYPLFPPHESSQLDLTHPEQLEFPFTPDILMLPSDLALFAKNVKECLCVNPGRITKGKIAGTYGKFTTYPRQSDSDESRVVSRTRVDIVRF